MSSKYWATAGSGLAPAPKEKIDSYTRTNGKEMVLGDLEWTPANLSNILMNMPPT